MSLTFMEKIRAFNMGIWIPDPPPLYFPFWERLSVGTVPTDKKHPVGTVRMDEKHPVGTVPMNKRHPVGTVPTDKMHHVGTLIFLKSIFMSLNLDCIAKKMTACGIRSWCEPSKSNFPYRLPILKWMPIWWIPLCIICILEGMIIEKALSAWILVLIQLMGEGNLRSWFKCHHMLFLSSGHLRLKISRKKTLWAVPMEYVGHSWPIKCFLFWQYYLLLDYGLKTFLT